MAVGTFTSGGNSGLLGESRSGTTWTFQTPPNVTGNNTEKLNGISCASASSCVAVGSYFDGVNTVPLAEIWNGSAWSVANPLTPSGASDSEIFGVSCKSSSSCMAVGSSDHASLTESWNGASWAIQPSPNPTGATDTSLSGVSCPTTSACTAVGSSSNGSGRTTLAEAWNGSAWSIQPTPNPIGFAFNQLNAVSCRSTSMCMAVGLAVAERWDGSSWTLEKVPAPPGHTGRDPNLVGVSCATTTACTAAGTYNLDAVLTGTAEAWNGTNWHVQPTPLSSSNDSSFLSAVSCTSPTACTAAGAYHNSITGEHGWVEVFGLRWQLQTAGIPSGSTGSDLSSVSCKNANACSAIGGYETATDFDPLAESWDGTSWTIQTTPNPTISNLEAVSCSASTACTAVGDFSNGGTLETLAERWDGTSWSTQATPNPVGATASFLLGVSCPSATACIAVGFYRDASADQHDFAESWNGSSWTLHSVSDPATGSSFELGGVSCSGASACQAVGTYTLSGKGASFAELWNGTSWSLESVPTPSGGSSPTLSAVSCVSASDCFAAGSYFNASVQQVPLVETWNGTTWSAQTPPAPSGASTSGFKAISCRSAEFCIGVGWRLTGTGFKPLAERSGATGWNIQATPLPAGAQSGYFSGVSCPTLTACEGVGHFNDSTNTETALAEVLS